MKIAVAGATGRVGRHAVEVLEARGRDVVGPDAVLGGPTFEAWLEAGLR